MHVLVVTVVHHPEDARILHRQIRSLTEAGHRVTYVAPWRATGSTPPAGVAAVDVPRAAGRARVAALRDARAAVRRLGPAADVLVLHDPELLVAVAGLRRPPTVWDVHEDTAGALIDKPWLPAWARPVARAGVVALERAAERRAHVLLADEGYRPRFAGEHPVVPNQTFVPAIVAPPGAERVVYLGRISTGRGGRVLLALPPLLPPGVRLELIGEADAALVPALRRADRDGALRWHGFVPNARALPLLDGALAGLNLVRNEPNYRTSRQTKVVEYMARGVPVVTTPNLVAAGIVRRHGCGCVVDYDDPAGAAAAIRRLAQEPVLREECGRRGHAAALAEYDWSVAAGEFVAALESWARPS